MAKKTGGGSNVLDRLMAAGGNKFASTMDKMTIMKTTITRTSVSAMNLLLSGEFDGGLASGLTIFAGPSKSFKTMFTLYLMSCYLRQHEDSIAILYDSEFSITEEWLKSFGIDPRRVIHIPIRNVEELKFDIVKRLEEIQRGDKVFIMIDSVGNLASKKEVEDAINDKAVADMTRAKQLKSLGRIITPYLTMADIPLVAINHTYETMEMFSKTIMGGGTGLYYSANAIYFISRSQDKDTDGLQGYYFTLKAEKSRYIKEGTKVAINVKFDGGINRWSGLLEMALATGHVSKVGKGAYSRVLEGGEIEEEDFSEDETNTSEFWTQVFTKTDFAEKCTNKYRLSRDEMLKDHTEVTDD